MSLSSAVKTGAVMYVYPDNLNNQKHGNQSWKERDIKESFDWDVSMIVIDNHWRGESKKKHWRENVCIKLQHQYIQQWGFNPNSWVEKGVL